MLKYYILVIIISIKRKGDLMIVLENIRKVFNDGKVVLNGISLSIEKGEIVSILGPSGSGKTTLLNSILGITDITSGRILCNGRDITNQSLQERNFNIVFQDYALFPNLNAYDNIVYGLRNQPNRSTKEEVDELIKLLDLEDHLKKYLSELSGGQKQRVALARTIVMKPQLLLLDEPFSALDGVIKESIKQRIKQIANKYQLTTIIVTHDPEEALTLSNKVLILNQGKIEQYSSPKDIISSPANEFVEEFIINQLEAKKNNIYELFDTSHNKEVKLAI